MLSPLGQHVLPVAKIDFKKVFFCSVFRKTLSQDVLQFWEIMAPVEGCRCCSTIFSFGTIFSELVQNTLNWYNNIVIVLVYFY